MSNIDIGPLKRTNIHQQFCSDWLKEEIERVMDERDAAVARLAIAKSALEFYRDLKDHPADMENDGNTLVNFGTRARQALAEMEK